MTSFKEFLNEIDTKPVPITWYYKKSGEWYGEFVVNDKSYDISFVREDSYQNTNLKIVSMKFARPDLNDPHSYAKDFNKPLVVANTVAEGLAQYLETESLDIFVIRAYAEESRRVKKYADFSAWLKRFGNFFMLRDYDIGKYKLFVLFKTSKAFRDESIKGLFDDNF